MPERSRAPTRRSAATQAFDADYYHRYYGDARSRVGDRAGVRRLAGFVGAYLRHLEIDVRSILDVGCGVGHWRAAAKVVWPRARWIGVEYSEHLCARHGWLRGSVVDFVPPAHGRGPDARRFDLVVCQGVLQYLNDEDATAAIRNLGRWCRGALYLEALTALDWRQNCDRERTDGDVHLRPGSWYHQRLARDFVAAGGGVFCHRRSGAVLFELEGTGQPRAASARTSNSAAGARSSAAGERSSAAGAPNSTTGARNSAAGERNSAAGKRSSAAGARNSAAGARSSAAGQRSSAAGARNSAACERSSAGGARSSAAGARNSAARAQRTAAGGEEASA